MSVLLIKIGSLLLPRLIAAGIGAVIGAVIGALLFWLTSPDESPRQL